MIYNILLIFCICIININAYFPKLEIVNQNEDDFVIATKILFLKINWTMKEIEKMNNILNDFDKRIKDQDYEANKNLILFRAEIKELMLQQHMNTVSMLMEMTKDAVKLIKDQDYEANKNLVLFRAEIKELILQQHMNTVSMLMEMTKDAVKLPEPQQDKFVYANDTEYFTPVSQENFDTYNSIQNVIEPWTVILRRKIGSKNFIRSWSEYKNGFGDPDGEFFIGFDHLNALANDYNHQELLVIFKDVDARVRIVNCYSMAVRTEEDLYKIRGEAKCSETTGTVVPFINDMRFLRVLQMGNQSDRFCEVVAFQQWWYLSCNGNYLAGPYPDYFLQWRYNDFTTKYVEMLIRPNKNLF